MNRGVIYGLGAAALLGFVACGAMGKPAIGIIFMAVIPALVAASKARKSDGGDAG